LGSLRWRYKIQVDVEETAKNARSKGFSVRLLEGQSRTHGEPYPLNQIEIKGGSLTSNIKVIVSPHRTQIYIFIKDIPDIDELERILKDRERTEQVLDDIVIFAANETARFSVDTMIPVMSPSMLKTQQKLTAKIREAFDGLNGLFQREIIRTSAYLTRGKVALAKNRMDAFLHELDNLQRNLIQFAKEQGFKEAEELEEQINEMISTSKRFEAELALAQSPIEIDKILKKYQKSLFKS